MLANLTKGMDFHAKALVIRADRQRVIASNIANADTPGFVGRDINFKEAMGAAMGSSSASSPLSLSQSRSALNTNSGSQSNGANNARHIPLQSALGSLSNDGSTALAYTVQTQPSMDGNSVDLDHERASFVDNAVHYEATLRFINGSSKTILSAIQGQ